MTPTDTALSHESVIEVKCVLGKRIRITHAYWEYISKVKHADLSNQLNDVLDTVMNAKEVWSDAGVAGIFVYYRRIGRQWACVVVRHLNGDGFIVTAYLTSKSKRKGKRIWQKK